MSYIKKNHATLRAPSHGANTKVPGASHREEGIVVLDRAPKGIGSNFARIWPLLIDFFCLSEGGLRRELRSLVQVFKYFFFSNEKKITKKYKTENKYC